jgi:ABC-2 type transport system ATP-binding protein
MIQLQQLSKEFKKKKENIFAVNSLSFEVKPGEILGVLGPNGAGKTTTIRLLSTLIKPSSGTAFINGFDIKKNPQQVRSSIGLSLGDERSFYYRLSGLQNLEFFGTLQEVPHHILKEKIAFLLKKMDLLSARDMKFMKYSSGMKKKLNICRALLTDPPVFIFDEPSSSIDPGNAEEIRQMILDLKKNGKTILLTTHNMHEAEKLCDRIAIINHGKLTALAPTQELKQYFIDYKIQISLSSNHSNPETLDDMLKNKKYVKKVNFSNNKYTILTTNKIKLMYILFNHLKDISDVKIFEPNLEEIFLNYCKEKKA